LKANDGNTANPNFSLCNALQLLNDAFISGLETTQQASGTHTLKFRFLWSFKMLSIAYFYWQKWKQKFQSMVQHYSFRYTFSFLRN